MPVRRLPKRSTHDQDHGIPERDQVGRYGRARTSLLLVLLAAGVFFAPIGQEPAVAGPRTDAAFVDSTNDLRAAHGLPRMRVSPTLSKLAYGHSVAMARKGRLWHNDISSATDHWVWLGQNVGVGRSMAALQRAFMDSPPHRANILRRKANLFGVGAYISQGGIWVTVNFEQTTVPPASASVSADGWHRTVLCHLGATLGPVAAAGLVPQDGAAEAGCGRVVPCTHPGMSAAWPVARRTGRGPPGGFHPPVGCGHTWPPPRP
jgi:uncharacterized protein YkwD